jgi:hypothetical protein
MHASADMKPATVLFTAMHYTANNIIATSTQLNVI